ncbi:hypothetical protein [Qipengyuania sediminis]|uniref:hypothetical protein n=1 Tax=Qipengyuania sediminis TaxID=1532023 RepID=UPI00105A4DCA|nr:hypothetical protein [Qipengyuania sediminis]
MPRDAQPRAGDGTRAVEIVNVPDVSIADDDFTHLDVGRPVAWRRLTGLPSNALERRITRVRLSRYRASLQAALAAREGGVVVSHLPRMTAATAFALRALGRKPAHLAFSFNFTDLPVGRSLAYMRRVLPAVEQFAVYSNHERGLYSRLFDIPEDRFVPVPWTQSVPDIDPGYIPEAGAPYFCAIGGEGRDFGLLVEVARRLPPGVRIVAVARPTSFAGLSLPDNLEVRTNVPLARTWAIANASQGVLIPLRSPETCCGHITFVSAKQLGIPIAATRSFATTEYTHGRSFILECEAQDPAGFLRLLERLMDEQAPLRAAAQEARPAEVALHHRSKWAAYVADFLDRHVP